MDRGEALRVVSSHLPAPVWRWWRWRMVCVACARPHPCEVYEAALDELAKPMRVWRPRGWRP